MHTHTHIVHDMCILIYAHSSEMENSALENQQPLFHLYTLHHPNPFYFLVHYATIMYIGKYIFVITY